MKLLITFLLATGFGMGLWATDARVEGMGGNGSFVKDEDRVFTNPAYIFQYPNHLIGSLGHIDLAPGKEETRGSYNYSQVIWDSGHTAIIDTVSFSIPAESVSVDRYAQQLPWGGIWAVYPIAGIKLGAGVIMNRNSLFKQHIPQNLLLGSRYNKLISVVEPRGETEVIVGAEFEPVQIAYKLYFARSNTVVIDHRKQFLLDTANYLDPTFDPPNYIGMADTVNGFNVAQYQAAAMSLDTLLRQRSMLVEHSLGLNYKIAENQELELSFNAGTYSFSHLQVWDSLRMEGRRFVDTSSGIDSLIDFKDTVSDTTTLREFASDSTYLSLSFNARYRYGLSNRTTLIPIFDFTQFKTPAGSDRTVGGGLGLERSLYRGLLFIGVSYYNQYQEYSPFNINRYTAANFERTSRTVNRWVYSFGIEKSVIFDWLTLRVGGQKVMDYISDSLGTSVSQNLAEPEDKDVVGFGIALTQGEHLRFDLTVSERFTMSNILAGNDNGIMFSRISAIYKF